MWLPLCPDLISWEKSSCWQNLDGNYYFSSFFIILNYERMINTFTGDLASLVAQTVKRLSAMQETWVRSLGWEDPLEKEMAAHSSTLAWKIPWTAEPSRLPSMGSKESDTTEWLHSLWKIQNKVTYISTIYYNYFKVDKLGFLVGSFNIKLLKTE